MTEEEEIKLKVSALQEQNKHVRAALDTVDKDSMRIAALFAGAVLAFGENLATSTVVAAIAPLPLAALYALAFYHRRAAHLYSGVCQRIETKINVLLKDPTLLTFENEDRRRMAAEFHKSPWAPAVVTYGLYGLLFFLAYAFLSYRAFEFLTLQGRPDFAWIAVSCYSVIGVLVILCIYRIGVDGREVFFRPLEEAV